MSQALHLMQLQKIDSQIDQINARLSAIESALQANDALLLAMQAHINAEKSLADSQKRLRTAEDAVQMQRIKIETAEAALYGGKIHNPKELTDLQRDILSLKRHLNTLEDQQLDAMLALEKDEASLQSSQNNLTQAQASSAEKDAGLIGERSQLIKNRNRLEIEREAVLPQVTKENLEIYLHLREQKRGLAVCKVEDGSCQGCGAALRPAELQAARSPALIMRCPSCGRILYAG